MSYSRLFLAAFAAFVVYFVMGGLFFAMGPLRNEYAKYPAVYRSQEAMKSVMPAGMAGMFVAMIALTVLYAMVFRGRSPLLEGLQFGVLIGVFAICSFVIHNHVNLNIGLKLTVGQAIAYFIEWVAVGVVIGLIYRPAIG
jgi:hypothetical protein